MTGKEVVYFLTAAPHHVSGRDLVSGLSSLHHCEPQIARCAIQGAVDAGLVQLDENLRVYVVKQ